MPAHQIGSTSLKMTDDIQEVLVEEDAEFFYVSIEHGVLTLWYRYTPDQYDRYDRTSRYFQAGFKGDSVKSTSKYIGSAFHPQSGMIWHVFQHID